MSRSSSPKRRRHVKIDVPHEDVLYCDHNGRRKLGYASKAAAKRQLKRVNRARSRWKDGKLETRVYYCQHCGRWHLTSQVSARPSPS